jgi:hypothetical protein
MSDTIYLTTSGTVDTLTEIKAARPGRSPGAAQPRRVGAQLRPERTDRDGAHSPVRQDNSPSRGGWSRPVPWGDDTFDYALGEDAPQVSITDAGGHDVAAALLATLLVGSLRNGRRRGLDLGEQAWNANDALVAHSSAGSSSPVSSCGSTSTLHQRRSSMLAAHSLCGCATGASRRSSWTSTSRSASRLCPADPVGGLPG